MTGHGHGHIHERRDRTTAKCGGPTLCIRCAREAIDALDAGTLSKTWMQRLSLWSLNKILKTGVDRRA